MRKFRIVYCLIALFGFTTASQAQGLLDGFAPKKGELSVTASYTRSNYKEFYAGKEEQDAVPAGINEINQDIVSLYAKYGITNKLSVVLSTPYIIAKGDGADPVNGESKISDFQDISIALKYNAYKLGVGFGDLNLITGIAVNIPTGYEPGGILSIGNGAFATDLTTGLHLNVKNGFFTTALATYSFKGNADNNFTVGGDFDVPDAFSAVGKIGYASNLIYVEGWIDYAGSVKGVDIGGANFQNNFPETKVEYTRLGTTIYKNIMPELGVSLGYSKVIDGRNIGAGSNYSIGITYNLSL